MVVMGLETWVYSGSCLLGSSYCRVGCSDRFFSGWSLNSRGFHVWVVNTRLFSPSTTIQMPVSVVDKQVMLFTMLTVPA